VQGEVTFEGKDLLEYDAESDMMRSVAAGK